MSKRILPGVLDSVSRGFKVENSLSNIEYVRGNYNYGVTGESSYLLKHERVLGNPRKFTFSTWFKRNKVETDDGGQAQLIFGGRAKAGGAGYFLIWLDGADKLRILDHVATNLQSFNSIRDTSSWYQLTVSVDTTESTASNRIKAWINGQQISFTNTNYPAQNTWMSVNNGYQNNIGAQDFGNNQIFDGLLAETYFVDNQALSYTSFAEFDANNMLQPKAFNGSVGAAGFYLKYNDTSDVASLGKDSSKTLAAGGDKDFGAVTLLLKGNTAGSNTFVDSSSNNFTVTAFGDTAQGSLSPFYSSGVYSGTVGSAYFDGSGDYLGIADNDAFNFGSGNWTVEFWSKATGSSNNTSHAVISQSVSGASSDSSFYIGHGTDIGVYLSDGTGWDYSTATTLQNYNFDEWHHIAVVRNGTSVTIYVDGISGATLTLPVGWSLGNSSRQVTIGSQNGESSFYKGTISNLRVVKGTAVYNSNFTRPSSPVTAISGTSLLLNFANTSYVDSARINNFKDMGGVSVNTSIKKYGTGSLYFNGSSYLKTEDKQPLHLTYNGPVDFTIEAWINTTDTQADLVSAFNATSPYKGYLFGLGFTTNSGKLEFYTSNNTVSQTFVSTNAVNNGQWRHIAVTRQGPLLRFYIDGNLDSTHGIWVNPLFSAENVHIGADKNSSTGRYYTGYLDNLRITQGIARYTESSFNLPADEFAEYGRESYIPVNMFLNNGQRITNPSYGSHRYWRYVEGANVAGGHHPRIARIILSTTTADTTIYTAASDNRSDTGTISPGTQSYDFGSPVTIVNAKIWSSYGDGTDGSIRSSYVSIQYSDDNSNWKTAFGGVMSNLRNTGIIELLPIAKSNTSYDSPTMYDNSIRDRGTYPIWNHQDKTTSTIITNGGLDADNSIGTYQGMVRATLEIPSTGKWYWETQKMPSRNILTGIAKPTSGLNTYVGGTSTSWGYWNVNGEIYNNGTVVASGNTINDYDVIGHLVDSDAGTLKFYKNNVLIYTANIGAGPWIPAGGSSYGLVRANFGQQPFAYSIPSGAKTINTNNFPIPTIKLPNRYFDTRVYTGNGSTQTISGFNFAPNLVWVKDRGLDGTEWWHRVYDSVRGVGQKALYTNTTENEGYWEGVGTSYDMDRLTAFTSDGFTIVDQAGGGGLNTNNASHIAWTWKEDAIAGFDIVTYTGDSSAAGVRNVPHNLGVTPEMIIIKRLNAASGAFAGHWIIQHKDMGTVKANASTFNLDSYSPSILFTEAATISYGYDGQVNTASGNYVAYLFRSVPGFSKVGSYSSNGLENGPYVHTGFAPKFVMWKSLSSGREWIMKDRSRETYNASPDNARNLAANRGDQENDSALLGGPTNGNNIDWMSNGFKIRYNNPNMNSSIATENYIYIAFAETPFKYARGVI